MDGVLRRLGGSARHWRVDRMATVIVPGSADLQASFARWPSTTGPSWFPARRGGATARAVEAAVRFATGRWWRTLAADSPEAAQRFSSGGCRRDLRAPDPLLREQDPQPRRRAASRRFVSWAPPVRPLLPGVRSRKRPRRGEGSRGLGSPRRTSSRPSVLVRDRSDQPTKWTIRYEVCRSEPAIADLDRRYASRTEVPFSAGRERGAVDADGAPSRAFGAGRHGRWLAKRAPGRPQTDHIRARNHGHHRSTLTVGKRR